MTTNKKNIYEIPFSDMEIVAGTPAEPLTQE
jgi:hypothetical protein